MTENEFRQNVRRIAESNRTRFGADQSNVEEYVAAHGQLMRAAKLTFDEARYLMQTVRKVSPLAPHNDKNARRTNRCRGLQSFRQKRCYQNSAILIAEDEEQRLSYCEGYVCDSNLGVVEHSWVTIGGKVVDLTLRAVDRKLQGRNRTTMDYFGVVIPRHVLRQMQNETRRYGPYFTGASFWRRFGRQPEAPDGMRGIS